MSMSRFSKAGVVLTAAIATWLLLLPVRAGADGVALLFGAFNGAAKAVAVDTNGALLVSVSGGGATTSADNTFSGDNTFYDSTPVTGSSTTTFRAGAGQSTTSIVQVLRADGDTGNGNAAKLFLNGGTQVKLTLPLVSITTSSVDVLNLNDGTSALKIANDRNIVWSSTTNATGTADLGLYRNAAGVLEINSATPGTLRDLVARFVNAVSGFKYNGGATLGTFLKGDGTSFVQSTNPAQEMSEFTTSSTGTIADLDFNNASLVRFTGGSTITLTGLLAGRDGQYVTLVAAGSGNVLLAHATGTAANRLINKVASGSTPLAASGSGTATYVYDGTGDYWRLVSQQQGAWITPTFSAGNYTGSGSSTWTVEAGDVAANKYLVEGTTLFWQGQITTTTVGGTPDNKLQVTLPQGYTLAGNCTNATWNINAGGAREAGYTFGSSADTLLTIQRLPLANWDAATNTTQVNFQVACQIN